MLTVGSLFAGIGGIELGLERTGGFKTVWQVENDPYAQKVLAKHWPYVRRHGDVRTFPPDSDGWYADVVCGGFPCQDVSSAGKRVGISGRRSGLWSEFLRIICTIRPGTVVVENTPGLLARGMDRVLGDLAASGFDAEWSVLPACAMGASHSRARVFIVAYAASERPGQLRRLQCKSEGEARREVHWPENESCVPRELDGIPNRVDRLRCLGNAVCPQVAQWIGERILESLNS